MTPPAPETPNEKTAALGDAYDAANQREDWMMFTAGDGIEYGPEDRAIETPKMDESANGLWWLRRGQEWVIARLEFKRFTIGAAQGELITARMFHDNGSSDTAFGYQSELNAAQWGGRILNPDEQPKPL